jgi:hypothetical protein
LAPVSQHAPLALQELFAQQGWPTSPHARQKPPPHASPAPVHASPRQQGSPAAPHAVQRFELLSQTSASAVQPLPGQQACPAPPHGWHMPP